MSKTKRLLLSALRLDKDVQSRMEVNQVKVAQYAEAIKRGERFPPIIIFFDGGTYWVASGFHRVPATEQAGKKFIEAEVHKGTRRDAILHSVGCNAKHGLPRTTADKERAVDMLLKDPEWRQWSNREIARRCVVSESFVRARRAICVSNADTKRKFTRNGKDHWQRVRRRRAGNISPKAIELLRDHPIADSRDEIRRLARKPAEQQVKIAQQLVEGRVRSVTAASFKVQKEDRRAQLDSRVPELNQLGQYRTLVIDPPWPVPAGGRLSAMQHYELMSLDDIRELPIADVAAPDSHLYLWVVRSFLSEGLDLVRHWGFELRSILTWVKTDNKGQKQLGSGHYFRSCTEFMLFGVRGNAPAKSHGLADVIEAPRGRHSEKPSKAYELVEAMSPAPYLDIFSRRKRKGWAVWGNEVGLVMAEEEAA